MSAEIIPQNRVVQTRHRNFLLRLTTGAMLFMLGIAQFTDGRPNTTYSLFEIVQPYTGEYVDFKMFAFLLGGLQVLVAILLWWQRWVRFAGLLILLQGFASCYLLFSLTQLVWHSFPFILNAETGQFLIKDLLLVGIGSLLLFEKKV